MMFSGLIILNDQNTNALLKRKISINRNVSQCLKIRKKNFKLREKPVINYTLSISLHWMPSVRKALYYSPLWGNTKKRYSTCAHKVSIL